MDWKSFLLIFTRILIACISVCYAYQVIYLIVPLVWKRKVKPVSEKKNRYAILIAARNEEKVLPHLLDSIQEQDYPKELLHIYVVADNCTDRTQQVAKEHGAVVYARDNRTQIGKGYALNYLLEQIDADEGLDSFDCFLVFDADNLLASDYITQINKTCCEGYQAFCGYRNTKNFGSSWLSAAYGVWYLHDSTHLNRSRMLLGFSCAVNGTGFGFTRQVLKECGDWNFFTLTEDLEFNAWCVTHGVKIGYCHDAILYDEQPLRFPQSWKQRTRWAQGGIQVALRYTGKLCRGLLRGKWVSVSCFETLTLSLGGCVLAGIGLISALVEAAVQAGVIGFGSAVLSFLVGAYASTFAMGSLTVLTEWKRIRATPGQIIMSLFAFPVFMLSFLPIAVAAPFCKFQWAPIEHTVAVSAKSIQQ